ncbi:MAG: pyruvate dehydrogenase (acetyl-transferring), homodimeric type, partial [Acidimicrobiia bacterium]|nr:pyruvate dehydrogenase (acetyl-transferring), homodimeric type [Acidimicrobiia bacterium]
MMFDGFLHQVPDIDPTETEEWLDSLDSVIDSRGKARATFLVSKVLARARERQVGVPASVSTAYVNTITPEAEPWFPGDEYLERRIRAYIRWNAVAMVVRANKKADGIGGHLATYASSAALYEVGFNHFFRGKDDGRPRDAVYFQGHASPGIYARAYLEGRIDEAQLDNFRQEVGGDGLSSYPHPRLMPEFWEFPTVSMGIGPINAVHHARFLRYLHHREIEDTSDMRVWCFVGDGEMDEPESTAALSLAGREKLDNLIFVVNCNLQRLDGPVRGNGKVIQELEALFRAAGWNVLKVIWGRAWDELLARDVDGVLLNKMNTTPDGEFQKYSVAGGGYIRDHFFGPDPRLREMVAHLSDDDLASLARGGHDYRKLYAAYKVATEHESQPSVILAKTVKGWTLGAGVEGRNSTHQIKKMTVDQLRIWRDRLYLQEEIPDEAIADGLPRYYRPPAGTPAHDYMMQRRRELDGSLPRRTTVARRALEMPSESCFTELRKGSGGKAYATTMAFNRLFRSLLREPGFGRRIVPIVPDEGRTFGWEALFHDLGIYSPVGQLYEPVDADLLVSYKERVDGQILEEGITEAGAMSTFTAAATSYATTGVPMVPFFIYYSMFGYQRVGDLVWALGDARGRGFMLGATAGRTTLPGEGLQHNDGHSHVLFSVVPNCRAYDPAFAFEISAIVRDGIWRMYGDPAGGEDVFYFMTVYNEAWDHPAQPDWVTEDDIVQGMYQFSAAPDGPGPEATILFSGPANLAAREAQAVLAGEYGVRADLWSVTSYKLLREEALEVERWNRLHPLEERRTAFVTNRLGGGRGPVISVTDYMKAVGDMIRPWVPRRFTSLGTDGYGRSDARGPLRRYFEVDTAHVVVA